ncbi:2-keto-4-pentenoate hydratase [Novosphingobium olei]|uniref:2-keto-4-pentenoate hydratase n=1 Tax=Novosphingobium olei TaxID=2728851 RepID=UPI0030903BD5|nr:2-keto-4-pentenoate hydratase [Novosphingobium olei]
MSYPNDAQATAELLVRARREATALDQFPGPLPQTLEEAYAIQSAAIDLWDDDLAGWKVGRLSPDLADKFGVDRFIGPIFNRSIFDVPVGRLVPFPVFDGGFGALEAEYVAVVEWKNGAPRVSRLYTGIEIAGSPVKLLPSLGSLATVADFGNNAGLLIGSGVPKERLLQPERLVCTTRIAGWETVTRSAIDLPGGVMAAFEFAVSQADFLGRPLKDGQFVSTGAITGIHVVQPGLRCSAVFGDRGKIECTVVRRRRSERDEGAAA